VGEKTQANKKKKYFIVTHWDTGWQQYDNLALTNENDDPETGWFTVADAPEVSAVFYFQLAQER